MFNSGQKVVCVNDKPDGCSLRGLTKGHVYTVLRTVTSAQGHPGVLLVELNPGPHPGWHAHRFRPLVERKTNILVFTRMLKKTGELV